MLDLIDSSTGSHQDEGNGGFIDPIDLASDHLPDQLRFFFNQLRLRRRQCSISDSHHIKTTVNLLKSEHTSDWLRDISGQLWSFKAYRRCIQSTPHPFRLSLSTKGLKSQPIKIRLKDFFEENSVTHWRDTSVYKIKIKDIGWSFHIERITNTVTSVKKDAEQEDEATIMLKMKPFSLVRTEGSDQRLPINW
jgi:hypothetical protein